MNDLVIIERPNSHVSEEIKKIRTNIKFSAVNKDIKTIMITSSVPGEGKSFISSNLAVAFAQFNEKVLLIDCDLRKGRVKKVFNIAVKKSEGLSALLINKDWKEEYSKYIKKTRINNLSIIPSGTFPPNPSELLASERFTELLEKLKEEYDVIILDCPPVIGLNDSLVVSTKVDTSLVVTRHKKTSMDLLKETQRALEAVGTKVGGVILNQIDAKAKTTYYYRKYYSE